MANIKFEAHCGCGFKTSVPSEAAEHSETQKHSMNIQGTVTPSESKKKGG
jgi:hypothetical protein